MWGLLQPWATSLEVPDLRYGVQLWTIPVELKASFVLYLYLIALAPLKPTPRFLIMLASQCYFLLAARWDVFLFLAGMMLANSRVQATWSNRSRIESQPFLDTSSHENTKLST